LGTVRAIRKTTGITAAVWMGQNATTTLGATTRGADRAEGDRDMAGRKRNTSKVEENAPRSLALAARGIHTGADFAAMMSAVMSDMIEGRLDPRVGNGVCNAGSKLLKVVEMQYRYGTKVEGTMDRVLNLVPMNAAPELTETVQ
jgi:hypothetical protein